VPLVQAFFQTRVGSFFYVFCYDIYKDFVEAPGSEALKKHIAPGSWAIDVGANIGFFTGRFARWVKDGGRVIAIEPDEQNLELLRRRTIDAGITCVDVYQAVAIEQSGSVRLRRNPQQPTDHRISDVGDLVDAITIDDIVEQSGSPMVGLIKIDTQGSECRVLAGATRTLQRCRPSLFIEIDDQALGQAGFSAAQLIGQINAHGYRFFKITPKGVEVAMQRDDIIAAARSAPHGYLDILCVPIADVLDQDDISSRPGE